MCGKSALLADIEVTSRRVAETGSRLGKIDHLAACLRNLSPQEVEIGVAYLSGRLPQGRIGVGPSTLREVRPGTAADRSALTLADVDRTLGRIAAVEGPGSGAERVRLLGGLLSRATRGEQDFLVRLLLGELRQGALEGLLLEALARASEVPTAEIRRAFLVAGDLAAVARAAMAEGRAGLGHVSIQLFRPVKPMLAKPSDGLPDALHRLGSAGIEWKLDGARVQVHRAGEDVRVFTRRLHDVTSAVPEIVEAVGSLSAREMVLDGEALALRPDGSPLPFQTTMRRFGRKLDVERTREELPLTPFFFDCLYLDGSSLLDRSAGERFEALSAALYPQLVIPRMVTADSREAEAFLDQALQRGHEGVVAKSLAATYEAGRRGFAWLKVKPAHTLDLVVLAAEWGHGRRRGWLSNLHLGARDPANGGFAMLGKTFKGMTDRMLVWQTRRLQELEVARDDYTVYVRPELVMEVAFNDVQASPQYPAGLALRFARVKRYRPDKQVENADTVDTVRAIYERQSGGNEG